MSLLGIDLGITGCKAIAFSEDGKMLARAYREYPLLYPKLGWIELNPNEVWVRVKESIGEVAQKTKKDPIKALAVCCQGEAFSPIDKKGNFLANSPVSFDTRGQELTYQLGEKIGKFRIMQITGMPLYSGCSLGKLMWLKKNRPHIYRKTWKFLWYEELVLFRLGFSPTTDYSLAPRTLAFDILEKKWSEEILNTVNIEMEKLPEVLPSGVVIGEIRREIANELSLPSGVTVVTGGHDQACATLGAGVQQEKMAMESIGTVDCINVISKTARLNKRMLENNFICSPYTIPDFFITLAFNFTGGALLRWFRDNLAFEEKKKAEDTGKDVYSIIIRGAKASPSSLFVLPHFTTTGTPYMDSRSCGAILGLSLNSNKAELIRAILEGIDFEMKLNLTLLEKVGVPVEEIRVAGGGAKSYQWLQLKADIYDKRILSLNVTEAACLGAAILAGLGSGVYSSIEEGIKACVRIKREFYPQKKWANVYKEKFKLYQTIYPTLQDLNHRITELSRHH